MTDRAQNFTAARRLRDHARTAPGRDRQHHRTPRRPASAIDARDFQRARKDRKTMAHLPQGPSSRLPAARTSRTRQRSSSASTRPAPNTPTSSSCTAAPASRRSRQAGPSATASTRSSASRTGAATVAPHRQAAEGRAFPGSHARQGSEFSASRGPRHGTDDRSPASWSCWTAIATAGARDRRPGHSPPYHASHECIVSGAGCPPSYL